MNPQGTDFTRSRGDRGVLPLANASVRNFAPMRLTSLALLLFLATTLSAQTEHGVFTQDIDTKTDACTNFFEYANGAWRAANPIPASMQRWSRRWAAGEQSKEQLRTLLDDESKRTDWPQGSIDQQISDFYLVVHGPGADRRARYEADPSAAERGRRHSYAC